MARAQVPGVLEAFDLITLAKAREIIGGFPIPGADPGEYGQDGMIQSFIHSVSSKTAELCHRNFRYIPYDEEKSGDGYSRVIHAMNPPIATGEEYLIWIGRDTSHAWVDANLQTEHEDFEIMDVNSGQIKFFGILPEGLNNIRITYTGGMQSVPASLADGVGLWLAHLFKMPDDKRHGLMTKSMDGIAINLLRVPIPPEALELIIPWILPADRE